MLTKSQIVLDLIEADDIEVSFASDTVLVCIPPETFRDMGEPDQITVTIEPDDRLNEES